MGKKGQGRKANGHDASHRLSVSALLRRPCSCQRASFFKQFGGLEEEVQRAREHFQSLSPEKKDRQIS